MEQKSRLFIYDRKEMLVLVALGVLVAAFAFTLGLHLGKRITAASPHALVPPETPLIPTEGDSLPNRQELTEQGKGAAQASDEALSQALHDEVTRTGVKLDVPRQVVLPGGTRAEGKRSGDGEASGSEKLTAMPQPRAPKAAGEPTAETRVAPAGKFTLQVGSHPLLEEARDQVDALEVLGVTPYIRSADVKGKGRWYRVYLGGYPSRDEAETAGTRYQAKKIIEAYIVASRDEPAAKPAGRSAHPARHEPDKHESAHH
jgi:cell division protein FtsN